MLSANTSAPGFKHYTLFPICFEHMLGYRPTVPKCNNIGTHRDPQSLVERLAHCRRPETTGTEVLEESNTQGRMLKIEGMHILSQWFRLAGHTDECPNQAFVL
jgi:hypothetical protein